jgi:hypothetical protein
MKLTVFFLFAALNSKPCETPPRKAVASSKVRCCSFLAANVNLPRTSRGHPPTVFTQSLQAGDNRSETHF